MEVSSSTGVVRNFLYNAAYQLYTVIVPLITVPYLSRTLGVEGVGLSSYTQSIANYFVVFAALGMATHGVREIAKSRSSNSNVSETFSSLFFFQLASTSVMTVAYIAFLLFSEGTVFCFQGYWLFWVISTCFDVSWLFFGLERFRIPTIRNFVIKTVQLIFIFLFVKNANDVGMYIAITSIAFLISQLSLWPCALRIVSLKRVGLSAVLRHLKPNLVLLLPIVGISLYTMLDKIMLGWISGTYAVGLYEYSERVCKMPLSIITALGTVMLPHMARMMESGSEESSKAVLRKIDYSMFFMGIVSFAIATMIFSSSRFISEVFFGEGFEDAYLLLRILTWIVPIIAVCNVIGTHYILPRGNDRGYAIAVFSGALVNVCLNLVLIPSLSSVGASLATVAAEMAVFIAEAILVREYLPMRRYAKTGAAFSVSAVVAILIMHFLSSALNPTWLNLLFVLISSFLVYVCVALAFVALLQRRGDGLKLHFRTRILK